MNPTVDLKWYNFFVSCANTPSTHYSITPTVNGPGLRFSPLPSWLRRILPLAAVAGIVLTSLVGFRDASRRLYDFAGYYAASKIVATEDSLAHLYDDAWFKEKVARYGMAEPTIVMYVNPPTTALFTISLTWLPPFQAKLVWDAMSVCAVLLSWIILVRTLNVPYGTGYRSLLFLLLSGSLPFLRNLQLGQAYVLIMLFFALTFHSYIRKSPIVTGVSLAALLLLKLYGWMFLILFAVQRRWKEFWWSMGFLVAGALASVSFFGVDTYRAQIDRIAQIYGNYDTTSSALRSIVAPVSRVFFYHSEYNPGAVAHVPLVQVLIPLLLLVISLSYALTRARENSIIAFCSILILSVLFTPLAADHHYVLMALPMFAFLSSTYWRNLPKFQMIFYALLTYLLLGWLPSLPPELLKGWASLLCYTRVYAAMILFLLLTRHAKRPIAPQIPG